MYRGTSSDATNAEELRSYTDTADDQAGSPLDPFDLTLGDPEALDRVRHDQNRSRAASRLEMTEQQDSPGLHELAREGDSEKLKLKIDELKKINAEFSWENPIDERDKDENTALHLACGNNHKKAVRVLVEAGASVDAVGEYGYSPLHSYASRKPSKGDADPSDSNIKKIIKDASTKVSMVMIVTKKYRVKGEENSEADDAEAQENGGINNTDLEGFTPLDVAIMNNNVRAAAELIEGGANIDENPEQDPYPNHRPLHLSCTNGHMAVTKLLLMKEAKIHLLAGKSNTIMHKAVYNGDAEFIRMLVSTIKELYSESDLEKLLDCNSLDDKTPLMCAVEDDNRDIVDFLIDSRENPFLIAPSEDPQFLLMELFMACNLGLLDMVKLLVSKKANARVFGGVHLLTTATENNQPHIVQYLMEETNAVAEKELYDGEGYTPLLSACRQGHIKLVKLLVDLNANVYAKDKNFHGSALYHAARGGHCEVIRYLMSGDETKRLFERKGKDEGGDFMLLPIEAAVKNGHLDAVMELLRMGPDIKYKDSEKNTLLHVAARAGHAKICQELLKREKEKKKRDELLHMENPTGNHALHEACDENHVDEEQKLNVIHVLFEGLNMAEVNLDNRNNEGCTPLMFAARAGYEDIARWLISNGAQIDKSDRDDWTAMHWACAYGKPNVLKLLLEKDYKNDFLGDPEPGSLASGQIKEGGNPLSLAIGNRNRDCVEAIVNSGQCAAAMRTGEMRQTDTLDENSPKQLVTPLRDLIREWPDLAKKALDKFVGDNLQTANKENKSWQKFFDVTSDSQKLEIKFDYELLDDTFVDYDIREPENDNEGEGMLAIQDSDATEETKVTDSDVEGGVFNDISPIMNIEGKNEDPEKVEKKVVTRSMMKRNHPLMIMVNENKKDLLGHPLCMALIRYKWNRFGRWVYLSMLLLYILYLVFLTIYIIHTPAPYSPSQIVEHTDLSGKWMNATNIVETILNSHKDEGYGTEQSCKAIENISNMRKKTIQLVGQIGVLVTASLLTLKELVQMLQTWRSFFRSYFKSFENIMELSTCILSIIFVVDFTECHTDTGMRFGWQWEIGAFTITIAWISFLSNVRMFPFLGIYVVMVTQILKTFLKLSIVVILFVLAFSLGFHSLLAEQEVFAHAGFSTIKTLVMMVGEMDFSNMFAHHVTKSGIVPTFDLPYPVFTTIYFLAFVAGIAILLMNLLVGVAIDNVNGVEKNAIIERLAMQAKLSLDFEFLLPRKWQERVVADSEALYPNVGNSFIFDIIRDNGTLRRIAKKIVENETHDGIESVLLKLDEVNEEMSKKDEEMKNLIQEIHGIKEIRYHQKEIAEQNKAIQEQNKELKEMLHKALSGEGRARR